MESKPRKLEIYRTEGDREPFADWMSEIKGSETYGRILTRLKRVEEGNLGDWGPVGEGVFELRFHFGNAPRIYFGIDGDKIILLSGGIKDTQEADIRRAKDFWRD